MKDHELLKTVCGDIYTITGIKPVIYNANMQLIYAHPLAMGTFCRVLRNSPSMAERCLSCDRAGLAQCRQTGEIHIYRCHMGLTEAVAPIMDRGTIIGYFLFGQLLEEACRSQVAERIRSSGLENTSQLLDLIAATESTQKDVIRACARLMCMCASYVRLQHIVNRQHKELAVSIAEYINSNLADEITIAQLCKQFGISRGTLYTISKNSFGVGITEYLRECRIDAAVRLLRQTDMSVCHIAEAVGINDANYLTKLIKKRTGITPKGLRKQA